MKTLREFDFKGKKVLVRCDFNVPLSLPAGRQAKQGEILCDFKIKQTLPTIEYLIKAGAEIVLISHLAGGASLKPVAERLTELLGRQMNLLDNLRLDKREEENDDNFARELAKLGDIFINDAFAECHRAYSSIVGVPKYLPSGAGLLLEKEVKTLKQLVENPKKPLVAIIGGAKVETKSKLINKLSEFADFILVGGLFNKKTEGKIIGAGEGLDIPEADLEVFNEKIAQAKTVFWNGPLGKIEEEQFSKGTKEIAEAIIKSGAFSIVGGGETVEFINRIGLLGKFSYVSTGGGAMMAFLSGEKLPGLEALGYYDTNTRMYTNDTNKR
ncbi:MAG: phosphoglycerate kinase [Patescibacteria group bacterium]